MLKAIKKLSLDSLIYGMGQAATRLLGFFLIPLYTRFLTTDDYGVLAVLLAVPGLLGDISNMGILSAFYRFFFDGEVKEEKEVIATTFLFNMGSSLLFFFTLAALSNPVSRLLTGSIYQGFMFGLVFAFIMIRNQNEFGMAIFRVERKPGKYSMVTIIRVLVNLVMTILFVSKFEMGVSGVLLGQLIPEVVLLPFLLILVVGPRLKIDFSTRLLRKMIGFGLPLTPVNIAAWIVNSMPITLLARLFSLSESGLYSMGYKFGALVLSFVAAPFQLGWAPIAYERAEEESASELYARVFTYLFAVLVFAVIGISLVAGNLIRIMATPDYYSASNVVFPVALGAMGFGLYVFFAVLINIAKKTYLSTIIWLAAAGLSVGLDFITMPLFGRLGAAWSYTTAFLLVAAAGFTASQKVFPLQYEWGRLLRITGSGIAAVVLGSVVHVDTVVPDLLLNIGCAFSMFVFLAFSGFLLDSEKRIIRKSVRSILKVEEI